ncbi:MAG: pyridine nucleotide-disulfide oxidoreductase [Alphaproteobacteria bacterium CG_4_10_14_0_2_um_filter_63_37]|nr:MAG: pyridine nucleotide-disulfide oxidoreductase [Proteobacteria bacterium CG1_02_64_396]PJA24072.1 MAG: pyridine nucleotide-disulfide oxidoreductase [Alphaproteobacteria bacterium CG_4_10_14_0_2_um_filter_63_37]
MSQSVLVVGGGPAGLSAAHALASVGVQAILVEKDEVLGGAPVRDKYAKLVPSGQWAKDAIGGMVERVQDNEKIRVLTGTTITEFDGTPGAFTAKTSSGEELKVGATVLATGFTHFDPINKPEWGYGTFPDVVTTTEVEAMISSSHKVTRPSDGAIPKRVCILLCVGSRDRQIGREYCSRICCTVSTNLAMEIKELHPETEVYIYYMDIRTFGLYEDKFYWKSQEDYHVKFVKARIAEITKRAGQMVVKGEDTLVKRPIEIPFDLVIQAIGMDPNELNPQVAKTFGVGLESHGYLDKSDSYSDSCGTTRPGVFVAGSATGPLDIDSSINEGQAAALRALQLINNA